MAQPLNPEEYPLNGDNDPDEDDTPVKAKKQGEFSCAHCCLMLVGVMCACCCCGGVLAVVALLIFSGPVGWAILGGSLVLFIVLFLVIFCLHQFVIEGTTFHLFNYFLPFLRYGLVSQFKGEQGVKDFWKSMELEPKSYTAEGIGPNTTTYFGWQESADMLYSWGQRLQDGTMKRHNELGTALMGPGPWPAMGTIALGYKRDDHAVARPFIAGACDCSRVEDNVPCDGSTNWSRKWLREEWRQRFDDTDSFSTSDMPWWCTKILHKIHLNIELSDQECQEFMNFPSCLSFPGAGKVGVGLGNITERELCLFKYCTPLPFFNCKTNEHLDLIKENLQVKYPQADWSEENLDIVGQMFLDSLMYAGGLSVPTILQNMLAWWYSDEQFRPKDLQRVSADDEDSIKDFMWETIRKNPPVAGVPRWVTEDGETWHHEIANVEQALGDDRVFPDPMKFKMGRPGLCARDYSKSISWADQAIVNDDQKHPDSHSCPGKQLSQDMVIAFWQEFLSCDYDTSATGIQVAYNLTSMFTLDRQ